MNHEHRQDPIDIPRGGTLRIDDGEGATLHVREGELWLTEEGGCEDHLLQAGQRYRIGRALRRFCANLLAPLVRPDITTF